MQITTKQATETVLHAMLDRYGHSDAVSIAIDGEDAFRIVLPNGQTLRISVEIEES